MKHSSPEEIISVEKVMRDDILMTTMIFLTQNKMKALL